jgi:LemA protein
MTTSIASFTERVRRAAGTAAALVAAVVLSGCGYNTFQTSEEQVNAAWSEVLSQYQRRADLIPNIVSTVRGEANFEQETLTRVVEARARATSIQATPELVNDPAAFQRFTQAQGEVSSALSRLLVTVENYPNLKANAGFQDLRTQLEGTENRIAIARKRYIDSVREFNVAVRTFPQNITAKIFGYKEKPNFTVQNEAQISTPPRVDFGTTPAPASAPR